MDMDNASYAGLAWSGVQTSILNMRMRKYFLSRKFEIMANRNDEDLGMFSNLYQSLTDRGPNKRQIKPLEGNLLQMTFGMGSSDEDDSDFVANEHTGASDDDDYESVQDSSQEPRDSQNARGQSSRSKGGGANNLASLSDFSDWEESDRSHVDADSEQESGSELESCSRSDSGSSDEGNAQASPSHHVTKKSGASAPGIGILEQDFNSDSDSSFHPAESSGGDSDSAKTVEKKTLRRRSVTKQQKHGQPGNDGFTLGDMITAMSDQANKANGASQSLVCSVCLEKDMHSTLKSDESEIEDEMLQCDRCGVAVHEGCFGLGADSSSEQSSSDGGNEGSQPRLQAWFCDICRAGARPFCALCLSGGPGVYKPTTDGRWVHTVCTLYTPGVVYGRTKYLSPVKLQGIARSRWNAKTCGLCAGSDTSSLGICIQCDAGLCKVRFHVTCAQKYGLLCEAPSNELVADPFFALCHQHCDKTLAKSKMFRYQVALKQCEDFQPQLDGDTISASLDKAQRRFSRVAPLRLYQKSEGDSSADEKASKTNEERGRHPVALSEEPLAAVSLSLSPDYVNYQTVRDGEVSHLAVTFLETDEKCVVLLDEKEEWEGRFEKASSHVRSLRTANSTLRGLGTSYLQTVATLHQSPLHVPAYIVEDVVGKKLGKQRLEEREKQKHENQEKARAEAAVAAAAAAAAAAATATATATATVARLERRKKTTARRQRTGRKANGGFNMEVKTPAGLKCCRCLLETDGENIIDCDRCHQAYHIYCLDPPLKRKPKKTSLCGWQCLDCDTSDSDFYWRPTQKETKEEEAAIASTTKRGRFVQQPAKLSISPGPEPGQNKRKAYVRRRHSSVLSSDGMNPLAPPKKKGRRPVQPRPPKVKKEVDVRAECCVCKLPGHNATLVRCDSCKNCYHFPCLSPPRKSCPKSRGYSWHCTECDSSDSDSSGDELEDQAEAAAERLVSSKKVGKASPSGKRSTSVAHVKSREEASHSRSNGTLMRTSAASVVGTPTQASPVRTTVTVITGDLSDSVSPPVRPSPTPSDLTKCQPNPKLTASQNGWC